MDERSYKMIGSHLSTLYVAQRCILRLEVSSLEADAPFGRLVEPWRDKRGNEGRSRSSIVSIVGDAPTKLTANNYQPYRTGVN